MKNWANRAGKRMIAALAMSGFLATLLTGCGTGGGTGSDGQGTTAVAGGITGKVMGGQQPVTGATIQLYAVGITGIKSAATPLISATVQSAAGGSFSITGKWNCTGNTAAYGSNPLLYIIATGGNPGLTAGTNNPDIQLMAALGPCNTLTSSSSILINEVTTVAAVYALAPFMADITHVGAQGANPTGLVNAFGTANLLVNTSTGSAPGGGLPSNATAPVAALNSVADIIAACVNSSGTDGSCGALFTAATPPGGTAPTNTVGVALSIAQYPTSQVGTLFGLIGSSPPIQPTLAKAPSDWTMTVKFTGGGLNAPAGLALDASGNVWVANAGGNSITELSNTGTPLAGASGYSSSSMAGGAQGIAIDMSGNVWVAETLQSSIVKLTISAGAVQSSTSFAGSWINGPVGLAIDSKNDIWVTNFAGPSVVELSSTGAEIGSNPLTAGGTLQTPAGIAIDSGGNVWVADIDAGVVAEFSNSQALLSGGGYTDNAMLAPEGIALDSSGRAWVADNGINSISLLGTTGTSLLTVPLTGGGVASPSSLAVDGQGVIWIANDQTSGSVSKVSYGQLAPITIASLNAPSSIAVDASGSIWTANSGDNSVSEIVGLATPVQMPLAATVGP